MRHGHTDLRLLSINNVKKFLGSLDLTSDPLPMNQKIAVTLFGMRDLPEPQIIRLGKRLDTELLRLHTIAID